MNWIEIAINGGGWLMILGIVKAMVNGKVNKAECNLKHDYLKESIDRMQADTSAITKDVNIIMVTLAKFNGKK